jgi:hypothetical protein
MRLSQMCNPELIGARRVISGDNTNRIDSHRHEVAMNS